MPEVALCECYAAVPDRRTHQFTDLEASTVLASLALRLSARSQLAAGNCSSRPVLCDEQLLLGGKRVNSIGDAAQHAFDSGASQVRRCHCCAHLSASACRKGTIS